VHANIAWFLETVWITLLVVLQMILLRLDAHALPSLIAQTAVQIPVVDGVQAASPVLLDLALDQPTMEIALLLRTAGLTLAAQNSLMQLTLPFNSLDWD